MSDNTIDKFGRSSSSFGYAVRGPPGIGFKLTSDGQFDFENHRLCNLAPPEADEDGVNRKYVDDIKNSIQKHVEESKQLIIDKSKQHAEDQQRISQLVFEVKEYIDTEVNQLTKFMEGTVAELATRKYVDGIKNSLRNINEESAQLIMDKSQKHAEDYTQQRISQLNSEMKEYIGTQIKLLDTSQGAMAAGLVSQDYIINNKLDKLQSRITQLENLEHSAYKLSQRKK